MSAGFGREVATTVGWGGSGGLSLFDGAASEKLRRIMDDGTPPNTRKAYASDLRYAAEWCRANGFCDDLPMPMPPELMARFVIDHVEGMDPEVLSRMIECGASRTARHKMSTVNRRVAAIVSFHKAKGMPNPCADPTVAQILKKARRAAARRGERTTKKRAAVRKVLDDMLRTCAGNSLGDIRDEAILLFGWASGGRRRSEITTAEFDRLEPVDDDYVYHLGITKTAQEGDGGSVPVAGRAARALRRWIEDSGLEDGMLFRAIDRHGNIGAPLEPRAVARMLKRRAKIAGYDPAMFSGHSLRSGFITEAGSQGVGLLDAMALSRHKSVQVASGYHQAGAALKSAAAKLAEA